MCHLKSVFVLCVLFINNLVLAYEDNINIKDDENNLQENIVEIESKENSTEDLNPSDVFDGVYSECVLYLSYSCIQKKTLMYLNGMSRLNEVPVFGDYVKFVKVTPAEGGNDTSADPAAYHHDLSSLIDAAVDKFFDTHRLRLHTLGRDLDVARTVDEFVGRKRRKGGGGGGGGDKGDGGKKKMMMMAMMCMKMKMMVMVPAMMGMMGMMSFKGMMFSMMSFMIAKMMLLMKILEKKGGSGGAGGADAGWAAGGGGGGGGGGAWMPAGGGGGSSDGYGGPGGGYNAAGEWQSRSIPELLSHDMIAPVPVKYHQQPIISYVTPSVRYSNPNVDGNKRKTPEDNKKLTNEKANDKNGENYSSKGEKDKVKSRRKRGLMDLINYVSTILTNSVFQSNFKSLANQMNAYPKYRIINGIKYVYYPQRYLSRQKYPKMMPIDHTKQNNDDAKPITVEDFNKGEIVDEVVEGRMNRKKMQKMKETVKDVVEDNPWE